MCVTDDRAPCLTPFRSGAHPRSDRRRQPALLVEPGRADRRGWLSRLARRGISRGLVDVRRSGPPPVPQADGRVAAARQPRRLQRPDAIRPGAALRQTARRNRAGRPAILCHRGAVGRLRTAGARHHLRRAARPSSTAMPNIRSPAAPAMHSCSRRFSACTTRSARRRRFAMASPRPGLRSAPSSYRFATAGANARARACAFLPVRRPLPP